MAVKTFSMTVVRPDDLLVLRLDFTDVDLTGGVVSGAATAMLVVHFQPQHVAEEAFWEQGTTEQTQAEKDAGQPPPPAASENPGVVGTIGSRIAGPSRLAFRIPPGTNFPLTLESVLDALTTLPLNVTAVARYERNPGCANVPAALLPFFGQPKPPTIQAPSRFETAIEAPYRLLLSPDDRGTWSNRAPCRGRSHPTFAAFLPSSAINDSVMHLSPGRSVCRRACDKLPRLSV